ncbi:DEAD/DEAH box helicase [Nocardioides jishulii]|uniref:DEAD/DEAH box helicase n=1 Tax=Nocardioides jishulii TaxID=2575440 RepID=A0A4U2YRJ5_9ACTN|nr:DEAD/DEAH box helicase [Nocardioides jishulii]QCX26162.1 DEAD/DEAH box helicase [Nocardioides jishulii]TKI64039.1 DEAD/DEAH box helicase [Nocardioides jishulii]
MSLVPTSGPATLRSAEPPREATIEFTGPGQRTVTLPVTAAMPVLARAQRGGGELHPTVVLLAGAAHLGLRLVADGRFGPHPEQPWWVPVLLPADDDRIAQLAAARADDGLDPAAAEGVVRRMVDAVVDASPRKAPSRTQVRQPASPVDYSSRLQSRLQRIRRTHGVDDRPQTVTLSLRVEAADEQLYAGELRLVPQVHAEENPLHLADASALWLETGPDASHGFGDRARTHASIAIRRAADAWDVLDRLLDQRVPDELVLDSDEITSLLDRGLDALAEVGVDVLWPRSIGRDLSSRAVVESTSSRGFDDDPLQSSTLSAENLFAFKWQVSLRGEELSEAEMEQLAKAATPVIKLRDNWVVVDPTTARRARKRLIRNARPAEAVAAALSGVVEVDKTEVQVHPGASIEVVRKRLLEAHQATVEVPKKLAATLRDYQHQGLSWLAHVTGLGLGAVLADDMGLGKTITLIALHLHRREAGFDGPTLVVCPASLLGNWQAEIERFAPGTPVRRFHGGGRSLEGLAGERPTGEGDAGFVLTTYGTMRNDAETLASVRWDLVVADEAQHVKNAASSTARALRSIDSRARVALTGTPVENNLTELWAILDWVVPGLLGSRLAFRRVWASPIEAGVDSKVTQRFADLIGPFLLRRRKSDPGIAPELPPKTETDHLLGLTTEQAVLYESFVKDRMERIERSEPEERRGLVLAMLTGLKQICNHPAQFLKQANPKLNGRSEKLDLLDELIGTVLAEDGAVLVFTQYVAMGNLISTHLRRAGVPHQFLHGSVPVAEREQMVRRFQADDADDRVPVFLLSLKAGGTGLNLTRADHVVHVDRWWNPAVEEQATDRAYRIGQTKPVQVHRMVTQGTVEERIAALLERKRGLADAVLGQGEAALTELSDDELRDLVALR